MAHAHRPREGAISMEREITSRRSGILARHRAVKNAPSLDEPPMSGRVARPTHGKSLCGETPLERRHPAGFVGFSAGGTPALHYPDAIALARESPALPGYIITGSIAISRIIMEAERINQIANRLDDIAQRANELRRYL
jgi:hypothetical protein